jgi:hypothetical protein
MSMQIHLVHSEQMTIRNSEFQTLCFRPHLTTQKMVSYASKRVKYQQNKKQVIQIQKFASHPIKEGDRVTFDENDCKYGM